MSCINLLPLLLFDPRVSAVALPRNQTTPVSWGNEPSSRGTIGVLFSCAAALALCVWTGVHLNVDLVELQGKKVETISGFLGKLIWALIALVAPDFVLVTALHQFLVALEYRNIVNKKSTKKVNLYKQEVTKTVSGKDMELKMAYFALMGGFSVEVKIVNGRQGKSITRINELTDVMMMDRIHDFPLSEVDDKSNASALAKIIACFQAGWILLQCLGRQLDGVYITLLELNTAIHVILAIVMYSLWWKKPTDVQNPIVIDRIGIDLDKMESIQVNFIQQTLEKVEGIFGQALGLKFNDTSPPKILSTPTTPASPTPKNIEAMGEIGRQNIGRPEILLVPVKTSVISTSPGLADVEKAPVLERAEAFKSDSQKIDEAVMIMVFCRAIRGLPKEAGERSDATPKQIGEYFRTVVKRDVGDALRQNYQQDGLVIPLAVASAAYAAAYASAHETAFKIAHQNIYQAVYNLSQDMATKGENAKQEWRKAFDSACATTRRATFSASLKAAFRAATNKRLKEDSSRVVSALGIQVSNIGDSGGKEEVSKPHDLADSIPRAAFNAARAATRSASRQSVRLTALQIALGNDTSAQAASSAFKDKVHDIYEGVPSEYRREKKPGDREAFQKAIEKAAYSVNGAVNETFRDHFREASGSKIGSDIESTVRLVKQASCVGLYYAVINLVDGFIDTLKHQKDSKDSDPLTAAYHNAKTELSKIKDLDPEPLRHGIGTHWTRLQHTLLSAGDVVWHQLFHVPGLFQPAIKIDGVDQQPTRSNPPGKLSSVTTRSTGLSEESQGKSKQQHETDYQKKVDEELPFGGHWIWWHRCILLFSTATLGIFYGGIHLTRFTNGSFPTHIEARLWQVACSVGTALIVPVGLLAYFPFIRLRHLQKGPKEGASHPRSPGARPVRQDPESQLASKAEAPKAKDEQSWGSVRMVAILYIILCVVVWVIFLSARAYMLIESVISLRSLPRDAFLTVKWADMIPHV